MYVYGTMSVVFLFVHFLAHSGQVRAVVFSPGIMAVCVCVCTYVFIFLFPTDGRTLCSCGDDDTVKMFSVDEQCERMTAKMKEPFQWASYVYN